MVVATFGASFRVNIVEQLFALARQKGIKIATAESCTGGMISAAITAESGSSDIFDRGFISYSNHAKIQMLDVPAHLIEHYGAVSAEVANAMAQGAIAKSNAQLSVSVTGIAGPTGATPLKPLGTVYISIAHKEGSAIATHFCFAGNRQAVRQQTVNQAIILLKGALK